jgi:hypothetical protein
MFGQILADPGRRSHFGGGGSASSSRGAGRGGAGRAGRAGRVVRGGCAALGCVPCCGVLWCGVVCGAARSCAGLRAMAWCALLECALRGGAGHQAGVSESRDAVQVVGVPLPPPPPPPPPPPRIRDFNLGTAMLKPSPRRRRHPGRAKVGAGATARCARVRGRGRGAGGCAGAGLECAGALPCRGVEGVGLAVAARRVHRAAVGARCQPVGLGSGQPRSSPLREGGPSGSWVGI